MMDDSRALSSQATKTFESGAAARNQGPTIRELKIEPLRRKLNNNTTISNTRRMGDELRRIGLQVTELPKIIEEDKGSLTISHQIGGNSKLANSSSIIMSTKVAHMSRAAAAQQFAGQQKQQPINNSSTSNNGHSQRAAHSSGAYQS